MRYSGVHATRYVLFSSPFPIELASLGLSAELLHTKFNQRPGSAHSDVWALGIILLNMVTGRTPWARASSSTPEYAEFVKNPGYLLERYQISPGLNKIIRRMLRANPAIRMRLPDVRRAITELDAFYRSETVTEGGNDALNQGVPEDGCGNAGPRDSGPADDALTGHKLIQGADAGPSPNTDHSPSQEGDGGEEMMRSTLQSEIDILRAARARYEALAQQRAQDCSAGSNSVEPGSDAKGRNENVGAVGACSRASSGQTSKSSTMVATPEDSEVVMGKREVGYRIKSIMSRVKRKLRYHS